MAGFLKVAVLSAALFWVGVMAYNLPVQKLEAAVSGKYQDRITVEPSSVVQSPGAGRTAPGSL